MRWIKARLYDGKSSEAGNVEICLSDGGVYLRSAGNHSQATYGPELLQISKVHENYGRSSRRIELLSGQHLEVEYDIEMDASLVKYEDGLTGFVSVLERNWHWLALTFLAAAAVIVWLIKIAVPYSADVAAHKLPEHWVDAISDNGLGVLDDTVFSTSALTVEEQTRQQKLFTQVRNSVMPGKTVELMIRKGNAIGANAFALPSGVVVITDELIALASESSELQAVYAHELGHLKERHLLRQLLRNSMLSVMIFVITSDLSSMTSVVTSMPVWLLESSYSREFEKEADQVAFSYLQQHGLDTNVLMKLLQRVHPTADNGWSQYFSTHPPVSERTPQPD